MPSSTTSFADPVPGTAPDRLVRPLIESARANRTGLPPGGVDCLNFTGPDDGVGELLPTNARAEVRIGFHVATDVGSGSPGERFWSGVVMVRCYESGDSSAFGSPLNMGWVRLRLAVKHRCAKHLGADSKVGVIVILVHFLNIDLFGFLDEQILGCVVDVMDP